MSVATASRWTPLTPMEEAAADPGSVAVGTDPDDPDPPVLVLVSAPDPVFAVSLLFFAARDPRTPPTTAAMITRISRGSPMRSHFDFRFGLGE